MIDIVLMRNECVDRTCHVFYLCCVRVLVGGVGVGAWLGLGGRGCTCKKKKQISGTWLESVHVFCPGHRTAASWITATFEPQTQAQDVKLKKQRAVQVRRLSNTNSVLTRLIQTTNLCALGLLFWNEWPGRLHCPAVNSKPRRSRKTAQSKYGINPSNNI